MKAGWRDLAPPSSSVVTGKSAQGESFRRDNGKKSSARGNTKRLNCDHMQESFFRTGRGGAVRSRVRPLGAALRPRRDASRVRRTGHAAVAIGLAQLTDLTDCARRAYSYTQLAVSLL